MATYSDLNKQITDLLSQEPAQRQQFQTGLETKYGLQPKLADLETLRKSSLETEKLLSDLPTQLKQRTAGMLMTSGQLGRQQAVETQPLAESLANLSRRENVATAGIQSIRDLINTELARRQQEQAGYISELQKQRDIAFQQEEANRARAAARASGGGGGTSGWDYINSLLGGGATTTGGDASAELDTDRMTASELNDVINRNRGIWTNEQIAQLQPILADKLAREAASRIQATPAAPSAKGAGSAGAFGAGIGKPASTTPKITIKKPTVSNIIKTPTTRRII